MYTDMSVLFVAVLVPSLLLSAVSLCAMPVFLSGAREWDDMTR
jgi:hypothetical protein